MPHTDIGIPSVGDTTRQSFAAALVNELKFLYGISSSLNSATIPNGSFELDGDSDGIPDEWSRTLFTNGSLTIDTSAGNFLHGVKAIKFVHPGGGGNGGGYVTSADYFEWNEKRPLMLQWSHKSSVAGMLDKVDVLFYDSTRTIISTVNVYSSTSNPTSWTVQNGGAVPPANTRYAKIRITGGDSSNATGGSSYWDDIVIFPPQMLHLKEHVFKNTGTFSWVCPTEAKLVYVEVIGGGGGGGGANNGGSGGGGGGAGGYATKYITLSPGTTYAVVVGAGGGGGTGGASPSDGFAGSQSHFNSSIFGNAGGGAVSGGGSGNGGIGGTASGGDVNTAGNAGSNKSASTGGAGAANPSIGFRTNSTPGPGAGAAGPYYGAGGAGGGANGGNGGAGADGAIIIRWLA